MAMLEASQKTQSSLDFVEHRETGTGSFNLKTLKLIV